MQIINRICEFNNDDLKRDLDLLDAPYSYHTDAIYRTIIIEMAEDDPLWPRIAALVDEHDLNVTSRLQFTKAEVHEAEWLIAQATGYFGYPQPEDDYVQVTYDTGDYCERCGMGGTQIAPFRLRSTPKQKRSSFLQLNWVFDEFFVRPYVVQAFEEEGITGVEFVNPVLHKTGARVDAVIQMRATAVARPGLRTDNLHTVTCVENNEESDVELNAGPLRHPEDYPYCGRVKYYHPDRTMVSFSRGCLDGAPDIVKSFEYFGSGGSAHRLVLFSQRAVRLVTRNKWRGIYFGPICLV